MVKTVCQAPRLASATELGRYLHWLSVRRRISYKVAVITYKTRSTSKLAYRSTTARHVSTVTGHLSQSPQNSSLQALLSMTSPFSSSRAREVTCHFGHVNRFYYLLTYLLTYLPFVLHLYRGFQCSPTLNRQPYELRLPLTSWWRKSPNMTVGQSSLISLAHHCYD